MSVLLLDGCDHYNTTILASNTGPYQAVSNGTINSTAGRFGGPGLSCSSVQRIFSASQADLIQGCWVKETGAHGGDLFRHVNNNGQNRCRLTTNALGGFSVTNGHNGALGTSSAYLFPFNQWNWVVWKVHYSATVGTIDVYVNGTNVWSLSGVNTSDDFVGGPANADAVSWVNDGSFVTRVFDDLFVFNTSGAAANSVPGPLRFVTTFPNGAGGFAQFTTTGAASNQAAVNEASPDDDTSYNGSSTTGNRDSFTHGSTAGLTAIVAVQMSARAKVDDAGAHTMSLTGTASATDLIGTAQTPSSSYANYVEDFSLDPSTSALWASVAAFNASEIGYKLVS